MFLCLYYDDLYHSLVTSRRSGYASSTAYDGLWNALRL